jgi:hypothetical protein
MDIDEEIDAQCQFKEKRGRLIQLNLNIQFY